MNARPLPPGHVRAHTGNTPAEHMPPPATGQPSTFPRPVEQHDADCDVPGFCGCNGWSTAHARRQPAPSAGQDTERLLVEVVHSLALRGIAERIRDAAKG